VTDYRHAHVRGNSFPGMKRRGTMGDSDNLSFFLAISTHFDVLGEVTMTENFTKVETQFE
jgi:hypothetical protein